MKSFQLFSVAALALAVAACSSGGGSNLTGSSQCPRVYNPFPTAIPDTDPQKITFEKMSETLPEGTYDEVSADLYYEDSEFAPNNNFRIRVSDIKDEKTGEFKAVSSCQRNFRTSGMDLKLSASVMASMVIAGSGSNKAITEFGARQLSFSVNTVGGTGGIKVSAAAPAEKPATPGKVYDPDDAGMKVLERVVLKRSETDYEIRAKGEVQSATQNGTYYLSVILRKRP